MASQADADTSGTLKELKEVIFDLDWEISDSSLDKLTSVITSLKAKWGDKKPHLVCLRIIDNVGHYIKKAKHKAHPEAVKLLSSVFHTLEKIEGDESLAENDRVNLVRIELEKYNGLKGEITGEKRVAEVKSPVEEKPSEAGPVPSSTPESEEPEAGEEREVVLTKAEDQSFPEAEQLLEDFFADDDRVSGAASDEAAMTSPEAAETEDGDETVEFELGGAADSDKKIANIFGATEAELEAKVGEKLGLTEEEPCEREEEPTLGAASPPQGEPEEKLEVIIDQFSREVTSMIAEALRKAVREEMAKAQQGE